MCGIVQNLARIERTSISPAVDPLLGRAHANIQPIAAVLSLPETLAGDGAYFSLWSDDAETPFRITLPDTTNRRVR